MPSQTIYVLYLCISSLNTGDGNFKTQFCNDGKRSDQNEISPAVTSEMGRDPFLIGNESWEIEREREREREEGFVFRTRSTQRLKWRMVKWRKSLLPVEAKNSFERDLHSSSFCEKNAVAAENDNHFQDLGLNVDDEWASGNLQCSVKRGKVD